MRNSAPETESLSVSAEDFDLWIDGIRLAARWLRPDEPPAADRSPLVFLHEGLGSIGMWREFPARLVRATGRPALLYDRHGHGGSDPLEGLRPRNFMHDEALRVLPQMLEQCAVRAPILFGHSDGGTIALIYAAHHPDEARAVVTEAAHVFVDVLTENGLQKAEAQWGRGVLPEFLGPYHGANAEPMVTGWLEHWHWQRERDWRIDDLLPRIRCPVLAIQGSEDEYGTPEQLDEIVAGIGGPAERLFIEGCGHVPHLQAPETVEPAVVRFIERYGD